MNPLTPSKNAVKMRTRYCQLLTFHRWLLPGEVPVDCRYLACLLEGTTKGWSGTWKTNAETVNGISGSGKRICGGKRII